jgi:bacteriocin-like protein
MERRNEMKRKSSKRQTKLSTDSLLKTSKKKDIELTEKELANVSGGVRRTIDKYNEPAKNTIQSIGR